MKQEKSKMMIYIQPDIHKQMKRLAVDKDTSVSAIVERLLQEYLKQK